MVVVEVVGERPSSHFEPDVSITLSDDLEQSGAYVYQPLAPLSLAYRILFVKPLGNIASVRAQLGFY